MQTFEKIEQGFRFMDAHDVIGVDFALCDAHSRPNVIVAVAKRFRHAIDGHVLDTGHGRLAGLIGGDDGASGAVENDLVLLSGFGDAFVGFIVHGTNSDSEFHVGSSLFTDKN
jgi:hypothetical protein